MQTTNTGHNRMTGETATMSMDALYQDGYGPPEDLEFRTVATPSIEAGEVLVRVEAAGVNRGDGLAVEGIPYAARLSYGLTRPKQPVPGTDVSGTVVETGTDVTGFEPGDVVFGWASGAFAGYAVASPDRLTKRPAAVSAEQAAASPTTAVAALQALRDVGRVQPEHHVLVLGASGGVGTFAVQIAKAMGATVTGVCSARNAETVRSIGADHVVDYTREDVMRHVARYDVVVDLVGTNTLRAGRRVLTDDGTYVVVGGGNPRSLTGTARFLAAYALSPLGPQRLSPLFSKPNLDDLRTVAEMLETGSIKPVVDAVTPLADGAKAIAAVHAGHSRGKVVLLP